MSDYPWIISVDDHVVEPPTLWTTVCRHATARSGRASCATRVARSPTPRRSRCAYERGGDGPMTDFWLYEERDQGRSHASWRASAIPSSGTRASPSPTKRCGPVATTRSSVSHDMDLNRTERSLCFPFITRFCGQMFLEAKDKRLAALCVRAYNDWMIDEWCGDSGGRLMPLCLIPLWDPTAAADGDPAQRRAWLPGDHLPRDAASPWAAVDPPSRPLLGSGVRGLRRDGHGVVHAHRLGLAHGRDESVTRRAPANTAMTFAMAQLSMVEWLVSGLLVRFPHIKIAYSREPGRVDAVHPRAGRQRVTRTRPYAELPEIITQPPSSYMPGASTAASSTTTPASSTAMRSASTRWSSRSTTRTRTRRGPTRTSVVERMAEHRCREAELERILRGNAIDMLGLDPVDLRPQPAQR